MKKIISLFLLFSLLHIQFICTNNNDKKIELSISGAVQNTQMVLTIIVFDEERDEINEVVRVLEKDLMFTRQFKTIVKIVPKNSSKKQLRKEMYNQFLQGISLAICINASFHNGIEWRIYDTMKQNMIVGKKYKKGGTVVRGWAHNIADDIWKELTGNDGFFSSHIAYCKEIKAKNGKLLRNIYVADFDGSNAELVVDIPTVTVFPRWNTDLKNPLLFYSEYTNTNVRLMSVDLKKKRKIASNFDGITMLPAFSPNNEAVVFSASRGDGYCQLHYYKGGVLQCINRNSGNNVSPTFADEEHLYFCSDFHNGQPQIYMTNLTSGSIEVITKDGYCTSPSFCHKKNRLAYCRSVNGITQLFLYDCVSKRHTQLTKTAGHKYECSWSPDGTQLIYYVVSDHTSRIAALNLLTNETYYLTHENEKCSYPAWSPCYSLFPVVS